MTFRTDNPTPAKRQSGFTLVEVLVALLLLAIVSTVAFQGLHVASLAGEVAQRKMAAARIGNKVLNELKVTGRLQGSGQTGVVQERGLSYRWSVKSQSWTGDSLSQMSMATVTVNFTAKGKSYDVNLSTLVASQQANGAITSGVY